MSKQLRPLMFAGTGSDVGKSVIAAAFCRIFLQDGYNPAPFKAQNMALNSYVTPQGLEIGRAQAVQASACKIDCHTDMNPILLKPCSDMKSQVVLNGKPFGNQDAYSYFKKEGREFFQDKVHQSYDRLQSLYNPIVLEGAGSIAEINLKDCDIVNLNMANYAGADVILVSDIDRGGVFASLYGTIMLLSPQEREMIKGIIINKFRGDPKIFEPGIKIIEELCKVPVIGIIPYFNDIIIEQEDSVALSRKRKQFLKGKINIAIVQLEHISNYTDFTILEAQTDVNLYYSSAPEEIIKADIIIIPGTKSTIYDMAKLEQDGAVDAIKSAYYNGKTIIGICGGYQIMGETISDPLQIESPVKFINGIGLLPVKTIIGSEKITLQREFKFLDDQTTCFGYEIHMGTSSFDVNTGCKHLNKLSNGKNDGAFLNSRCFGTYIHGILDNQSVINYILMPFRENTNTFMIDYESFTNNQFDRLAHLVRTNTNMELLYNLLKR